LGNLFYLGIGGVF